MRVETQIEQRLTNRIARKEILPILEQSKKQLIEEHEAAPFGPHSLELFKLLVYLRRHPPGDRYALVLTKPHEEWRLAVQPPERDQTPDLLDERYATQEEAEHEIFKKRIKVFEAKYRNRQ